MLTILPDRITTDVSVKPNTFCIPVFSAISENISLLDSGLSDAEEYAQFAQFFENGGHIQGVTLTSECEKVAELYESLGYFCKETNRFEVDFMNAPVTLGCYFENLFSEKNGFPQRHTGHQKSLRKALNSGVISVLLFRDTKPEYIQKALQKLIASEEFSPFRLGRMLAYNAMEIPALRLK